MVNRIKAAAAIFSFSKYLGIALIAIGIPTMVLDPLSGSEIPLLTGLFTLLISSDKTDDERSIQIKTTSLYFAFIISYATKLITTNLHDHALIPFQLVEINHFLILTLAAANVIYYLRLYILKN